MIHSHTLIGCPADMPDLTGIGTKRGAYTVSPSNTLAGDDIHPLNGEIEQRYNQFPFNQEIKFLSKPLDKEPCGLSF
jgi:hypothetical protein